MGPNLWENSERVVLGVLNPHRCEIEPVDTDLALEHEWADKLVGVHVSATWETIAFTPPLGNGQ